MARTRTTTKTSTASAVPTEGTAPVAGVQQLDPAQLLVDVNVRHDARLTPAFIASIKDQGVLMPIVAVRTAEGEVRVRYGHRRTLAAIQAGLPAVPVLVIADEASEDAAQVERILGQWAENEHRTGLTVAERVDATAQLAAFGISAAQIAKRTHTPRAQVDAALAVAGADLAKAAAARWDFLDLAQAATLAEFDDDTEAIKALVAAAKTGQFEHTAQRLRDTRAETARRRELQDSLRAEGITIIETPSFSDAATRLDRLTDADGNPLDQASHRGCPGHAAYLVNEYGYLDTATGAPIPEENEDGYDLAEDDHYDDDGEGAEGGASSTAGSEDGARPQAVYGTYLGVAYACADPAGNGHQQRWGGSAGQGTGKRPAAEMDETEREAARAERREVIACNKAWASAQTVRGNWLREFATRKSPPKGTSAFLATALALDAEVIVTRGGHDLAAQLLGCPEHRGWGRNSALAQLAADASETHATQLALVQVLAGYEDHTDRDHWRHPRPEVGRYLRFLETCGYGLSEVEQRACAAKAT